MAVLVTGAAGFIGFHTSLALLGRGERVIGVDDLNDYYDVTLKEARLACPVGRSYVYAPVQASHHMQGFLAAQGAADP